MVTEMHPWFTQLKNIFILDLFTGETMDLTPTTGLFFIALLIMHVVQIDFCTLRILQSLPKTVHQLQQHRRVSCSCVPSAS